MGKKHMMEQLQEASRSISPLCVGLDTSPDYLPDSIIRAVGSKTQAVLLYNRELIRLLKQNDAAGCVKVQVAYYEAMGVEGMNVYSQTLAALRQANIISIADIKRGDIGATSEAYALAHFSGDFEADIVTLNPYMGHDAIEPFTKYFVPKNKKSKDSSIADEVTEKRHKSAFILLCTSNPGAADIEMGELQSGDKVYSLAGSIITSISEAFHKSFKNEKCSIVGAVVGATQSSQAQEIREKYPDVFFLIPGFGAQGGDTSTIQTLLTKAGGVVNSSRAILCAWTKDKELSEKRKAGLLCISDIAQSALRAALSSKATLQSLMPTQSTK